MRGAVSGICKVMPLVADKFACQKRPNKCQKRPSKCQKRPSKRAGQEQIERVSRSLLPL